MSKLIFVTLSFLILQNRSFVHAAALTQEQKVQLERWQVALEDKSVTENTWADLA